MELAYSEQGNLKRVREILDDQTNVDNKILALKRGLSRAAYYGHLVVVKYLVEQGADIRAERDGALRWASCYGHLDVVKYLVEQGADVHAEKNRSLRWASSYGHLEVVKYLIEQGADIHACQECALRWASQNGRLDVVKYLVENGADTEGRPLSLAFNHDQFEVVEYLKIHTTQRLIFFSKVKKLWKERQKFSKN